MRGQNENPQKPFVVLLEFKSLVDVTLIRIIFKIPLTVRLLHHDH